MWVIDEGTGSGARACGRDKDNLTTLRQCRMTNDALTQDNVPPSGASTTSVAADPSNTRVLWTLRGTRDWGSEDKRQRLTWLKLRYEIRMRAISGLSATVRLRIVTKIAIYSPAELKNARW